VQLLIKEAHLMTDVMTADVDTDPVTDDPNTPSAQADALDEQLVGRLVEQARASGLQVEKSFRMSKTDLAARPVFHHTRESIEAHLTIVFAALAVSRWIETPPAGPSNASSPPPAATERSRSKPATTPSPPPTPYPTSSAPPSTPSTARTQ
jgi:hypothetical protein